MEWLAMIIAAYSAIILIAEVTRPGYKPGDWRRDWPETIRLIIKGE